MLPRFTMAPTPPATAPWSALAAATSFQVRSGWSAVGASSSWAMAFQIFRNTAEAASPPRMLASMLRGR